jgi:four helix bundle protein
MYNIVDFFPYIENKALSDQLNRVAVSIPTDIVEGASRHDDKEFIQYHYQSFASLSEIAIQLVIAKKENISDITGIMKKINDIQKIRMGLIKYLRNK